MNTGQRLAFDVPGSSKGILLARLTISGKDFTRKIVVE